MAQKIIVNDSRPPTEGEPNVEFIGRSFNALIWQKGYNVVVERAIICPCRDVGNATNARTGCMNCRGSGWVFVNPIATKGVLHSMNKDTQFKDWSEELIGTASFTLEKDPDLRIGLMDRITFMESDSMHSEIKKIRQSDNDNFIFADYSIEDVDSIYVFTGESNKLVKLNISSYSLSADNSFVVNFTDGIVSTSENNTISMRYKHKVQYHVIDIPHHIRQSTKLNNLGQNVNQELPLNYTIRLSHLILNQSNYDGSMLINNDDPTGTNENSYNDDYNGSY